MVICLLNNFQLLSISWCGRFLSFKGIFDNTSTEGKVVTAPSWIFAIKTLICMSLVLEDMYEPHFSIDTIKGTMALHLTSQWRFKSVTKTGFTDFHRKKADFSYFRVKSLENRILKEFLLLMKENYYLNIHRKFQVHSTNICRLGAKKKQQQQQHTQKKKLGDNNSLHLAFTVYSFTLFCVYLFCFVLLCFVLFCFVLVCSVLFCFVLFLFCFLFTWLERIVSQLAT